MCRHLLFQTCFEILVPVFVCFPQGIEDESPSIQRIDSKYNPIAYDIEATQLQQYGSQILKGTFLVETTIFVKTYVNHDKKSSKFTKNITHVDDMITHNLVKYLVQIRLHL